MIGYDQKSKNTVWHCGSKGTPPEKKMFSFDHVLVPKIGNLLPKTLNIWSFLLSL